MTVFIGIPRLRPGTTCIKGDLFIGKNFARIAQWEVFPDGAGDAVQYTLVV